MNDNPTQVGKYQRLFIVQCSVGEPKQGDKSICPPSKEGDARGILCGPDTIELRYGHDGPEHADEVDTFVHEPLKAFGMGVFLSNMMDSFS